MDRRLELQELLESFLPEGHRAWFQSPSNDKLVYPTIVYSLIDETARHADNEPYMRRDLYSIQVIDRNPDSKIWREIASLPLSSFTRRYVVDNLYHSVLNLHF